MSYVSGKKPDKDDKGKHIQVFVRCRPLNGIERKANSYSVVECDQARKELSVKLNVPLGEKSSKKTYTYDMVFGPAAKQIEIYKSVVYPILDEVILGYNCTVFAYGQTGTGKTFTMEGERSPNDEFTWEEDPLAGVIPRTLHQIFEKLTSLGVEFSVKVSLLEIYNEELFDLLSSSPDIGERLQMFDDPRNKGAVLIKGLEEVTVHNKDEVYHILEHGAAKRRTASTLMNAYSSRSHSVFSITIHMKETMMDGEELVKIGKLNMVDLAGSENIGRSGAVDKRAREAGNINQSLLTLGRVITALVERTPHIPYRESKLTRLLQDSLGGRTKTSIIATISPAAVNIEETLSTLEYAARAKNIMNKPEVNQKLTKKALIKEYTEEIERLKKELSSARDKNGVYLPVDSYEAIQGKLTGQEQLILECNEKISTIEEEIKKVTELFTDSQKELNEKTACLEQCQMQLHETFQDLSQVRSQLQVSSLLVEEHRTTEEKLYKTANQLLLTADETTEDLQGLQMKLERKTVVETHNEMVSTIFSQQIEQLFTEAKGKMQMQRDLQCSMVDSYTASLGDVVKAGSHTLQGVLEEVEGSVTSLKKFMQARLAQFVQTLHEQKEISKSGGSQLDHTLKRYVEDVDEMMQNTLLPTFTSLNELNMHNKKVFQNLQTTTAKAEEVKDTLRTFTSNLVGILEKLRLGADSSIRRLAEENSLLKQKLKLQRQQQAQEIRNVMQTLNAELTSLDSQAEDEVASMLHCADNVDTILGNLHNTMKSDLQNGADLTKVCGTSMIDSLSGVHGEMHAMSNAGTAQSDLAAEKQLSLCAELNRLHASSHNSYDHQQRQLQQMMSHQETSFQENQNAWKASQKDSGTRMDAVRGAWSCHLQKHELQLQAAIVNLQRQMEVDREAVSQLSRVLEENRNTCLQTIKQFFHDDFKKDIPTGTTPQRKEYRYPRVLQRTEPHDALVEKLQQQVDTLHGGEPLPAQEIRIDNVEESDSFEEESTEKSDIDEDVPSEDCSGLPFFQRASRSKKDKETKKDKENKALSSCTPSLQNKSNGCNNDAETATFKSKIPLQIHNN
ncbi:kinesin-like protein KIF11 [Lampetra fluviatilis]